MVSVSVIIPTYNRREKVSKAIESVLSQTFRDFELIVVDDASEEDIGGLVKRISDSRISYIAHKENKGGAAARNTGIIHAEGEYIAFLDSDDYWLPEKLERQVSVLQNRSDEYVAVYCGIELNRSNWLKQKFDNIIQDTSYPTGSRELIDHLIYPNTKLGFGSTLLMRRSAAVSIGGFDESFTRHQDIQFGIAVALTGKCAAVEDILVKQRESAAPSTDALRLAKQQLYRFFEVELDEGEYDIKSAKSSHRFQLARAYIQEGQFRNGINYLQVSRPHTVSQYARLLYSGYRGMKNRFRMNST